MNFLPHNFLLKSNCKNCKHKQNNPSYVWRMKSHVFHKYLEEIIHDDFRAPENIGFARSNPPMNDIKSMMTLEKLFFTNLIANMNSKYPIIPKAETASAQIISNRLKSKMFSTRTNPSPKATIM